MKKIRLKKLSMTNFKGIKNLEIDFDQVQTSIKGDNGTGKTTVFDAFTWLLFGKDHLNNAKFNIKTLDPKNKVIHKLNHEVEGVFEIDGEKIVIKRSYKEKWVKQRGSLDPVLTGNVTNYFCDDVPKTATEFSETIKSIIDEDLFKLLTNPFYFNSLAWTIRRSILEKIANVMTDQELAQTNDDYSKLFSELSGRSLADYKKVIAAAKKKIKDQLDEVPTRIDELTRSIPESQDFQKIKDLVLVKEEEIEKIVSKIIDVSKVDDEHLQKISSAQKVLSGLKDKLQAIQDKARTEAGDLSRRFDISQNEIKRRIKSVDDRLDDLQYLITKTEKRIGSINDQIIGLRSEFDVEAEKTIPEDESDYSCPTCKREFDESVIAHQKEEMKVNFNTGKSEKLESINKRGKSLKDDLIAAEKNLVDLKKEKSEEDLKKSALDIELKALVAPKLNIDFTDSDEYKDADLKVKAAEQKIDALRKAEVSVDQETINGFELQKRDLKKEIEDLSKELYKEDQIKNGKERLKKLEDQGRLYASEFSELDGKDFLIDQFNSEKMSMVEKSINSLFPTVRFKLFSHQLNGGVAEACETLINGVPFDGANNAAKITAGVEIINVLSNHYKCNAPIFIDNAESIVRKPDTSSQMITLVVSEIHKELSINV